MPAVLFIRAGILLGERPGEVVSYQEHFFQYRVQFFSLGCIELFGDSRWRVNYLTGSAKAMKKTSVSLLFFRSCWKLY
jgi:hypothetical protein